MEMTAIKPGRYRHFKGNEYEVLFVAKHTETEEDMVVYKALKNIDFSIRNFIIIIRVRSFNRRGHYGIRMG